MCLSRCSPIKLSQRTNMLEAIGGSSLLGWRPLLLAKAILTYFHHPCDLRVSDRGVHWTFPPGTCWQGLVHPGGVDQTSSGPAPLPQAMEVHEQIQENAASLTPGAEMMRSRDDLQQDGCHATV